MAEPRRRTVWNPLKALLDGLLVMVVFIVAIDLLATTVLMVDPTHPLARYTMVTTTTRVPAGACPTEGLVRMASDVASVSAEPLVFLTFHPLSRTFLLGAVAATVPWWACVILVLVQLRGLFKNLKANAPFQRENIRRVRAIGWSILGMAAADLFIAFVVTSFLRALVTVGGQPAEVPTPLLLDDLPIATIIAGLAIVILGEIFRAGADLQDDQALTI